MAEIKICGLTNATDARVSVEAGAHYIGVVFAGGPRALTAAQARDVFDGVGGRVRRVGVIGNQTLEDIVSIATMCQLDIVQLHADPNVRSVTDVRDATACAVWAAIRVQNGELPQRYDALAEEADAVVLDSYSHDRLGGTGLAFRWSLVAASLHSRARPRRLVLAGGLQAHNVRVAIGALHPDVVDVSSGVEQVVGRKDHDRIRAFVRAAQGGTP